MVGPQVFRLGNHMAITNFRTWRPDLWILILRHRKIHYENTLRLSSPSKFPQDLPANHFILENFNIFQTNSSKPHPTISRKKPTKQQKKHVTTYYPAAAGSPMCPHFLVPGFWSWKPFFCSADGVDPCYHPSTCDISMQTFLVFCRFVLWTSMKLTMWLVSQHCIGWHVWVQVQEQMRNKGF